MAQSSALSINNAVGNLLPFNKWTVKGPDDLSIHTDSSGSTTLISNSTNPIYLVAKGNGADLESLSMQSGVAVHGRNAIEIFSSITPTTGASVEINIFEFDEARKHLERNSIKPNEFATLVLNSKTAYVLVSLRIMGFGETSIDYISANAVIHDPSDVQGITYGDPALSLNQRNEDAIGSKLTAIRHLLNSASSQIVETLGKSGQLEPLAASMRSTPIAPTRSSLEDEIFQALISRVPKSFGSRHHKVSEIKTTFVGGSYITSKFMGGFQDPGQYTLEQFNLLEEQIPCEVVVFVSEEIEETFNISVASAQKLARSNVKSVLIFLEDEDLSSKQIPLLETFDLLVTFNERLRSELEFHFGESRVLFQDYFIDPVKANPVGSNDHRIQRVHTRFEKGVSLNLEENHPNLADSLGDLEDPLIVTVAQGSGKPQLSREIPLELKNSGEAPKSAILKVFEKNLIVRDPNSSLRSRINELETIAAGVPTVSEYELNTFSNYPEIRTIGHLGEALDAGVIASFLMDEYLAVVAASKVLAAPNTFDFAKRLTNRLGITGAAPANERILVVSEDSSAEIIKSVVEAQYGVDAVVVSASSLAAGDINLSDFGYVAYISEDNTYEPYYLLSRLATFKYADIDFVTQGCFVHEGNFIGDVHNDYIAQAVRRDLTVVPVDNTEGLKFLLGSTDKLIGRGYASHRFGVNFDSYLRRVASEAEQSKKLSVIVPVYNNGKYLLSKCIPSLLRNASWHQMEVLLIDDGSTDARTIAIEKFLESSFPNVQAFFFDDGGSGSASRPRNKGVELATANWITYLDPDNEISPHGYDNLLKILGESHSKGLKTNFVSGFQVKLADQKKLTGTHTKNRTKLLKNAKADLFLKGKFPVVSTQCAVISKAMLMDNSIEFIEGAAGQDSLYGWQVLLEATDPIFTADAHLLYYAERADSITNAIDANYFRKCLVREEAQSRILDELGVLEAFKEHHYPNFMKNWYIPKLELLPHDQRTLAEMIVGEIAAVYNQVPPVVERSN